MIVINLTIDEIKRILLIDPNDHKYDQHLEDCLIKALQECPEVAARKFKKRLSKGD